MSEETKDLEREAAKPQPEEKSEPAAPEQKPKKVKKSKSAENQLKEQLAEQKELLMRTAAEFDNFKKRTEREKLKTAEYSKAKLIEKLLPIIDNANRALGVDPQNPDYAKGIEMIVKQLCNTVNDFGLEELAAVGDVFDPNIHEAVMHVEDPEKTENEIVAVLQQGYKIGDTVIRPAMVQVAN